MALASLSRSSSKSQGAVKSAPTRKPVHGQHSADSRFGFTKPIFRAPTPELLMAPVIQTKLKVGEPNNKFEQEADRVADEVTKMPEALPPGAAIRTSASVSPSSAIQPHCIECVRSGGLCPQCLEKDKIESNILTETTTFPIQRKLGDVNKPDDKISLDKKAELEFHSALHFNRSFSGFNPTGPPKEGEGFIIWWRVWNTGWKTAPQHTNRLTIYKADLCSGCRSEKDEIFRGDTPAPSIVSITQQGESDYENALLIGMSLSAGHYDAYVELDVHNQVEEINEDNNSAFMVFVVKPDNESDLAIGREETIQPKKDVSHASNVEPDVESQISGLRGRGQPLPESLRAFFEPRFGYDFSQVRVHTDENAQRSARTLDAQAYTVGNDIVFALTRFAPTAPKGHRLLAHELTHVVQQSAGHASRAVARQPANTPPKVPECHTGCAQRWGQDTTCSKWGFQQGVHDREPQFVIEVKGKKLKLIPCCNSWPWSLEDYARRQLGLNGAASCPVQHERQIATISFGEEEVKVLCSDTISNDMVGETKSASACSGKINTEVIEMSPKAMQELSGQVTNALHVKVCFSGSKQDLCPHNGPGKAIFPEIEHCLTTGCSPPEGTPKLRDTGWPRR
jgi:hypothetical protein